MDSRREFIKKAAMIAGATGLAGVLPPSIQKALAIDPPTGSTWLDAEHVVILMQENRSFDHCFGMLKGVRGYRDPRAVQLPDGNPVWLQTNAAGSLKLDMPPGSVMAVSDHINFTGVNPLFGIGPGDIDRPNRG